MTETKRHATDIVPASLDLEETQAAQQRASRPDASAWVNANAGSGKTHVLKMRVQRLLLSGVKPEHILCLTFTKAAAAEMSNRVFTELGNWAVLNDDDLTKELVQLAGIDEPTPEILRQARRLFARANSRQVASRCRPSTASVSSSCSGSRWRQICRRVSKF
ncbi:MAG: UvrD-helicase domain-containing protein [Pseudomonadota bacterium]